MKNTKDINNASDGTFIRHSQIEKINAILSGEEDIDIFSSLELWHLGELELNVYKKHIANDKQKGFLPISNAQEIFFLVAQALVAQELEEVPTINEIIHFDYSDSFNELTPNELAQEYIEGYKDPSKQRWAE